MSPLTLLFGAICLFASIYTSDAASACVTTGSVCAGFPSVCGPNDPIQRLTCEDNLASASVCGGTFHDGVSCTDLSHCDLCPANWFIIYDNFGPSLLQRFCVDGTAIQAGPGFTQNAVSQVLQFGGFTFPARDIISGQCRPQKGGFSRIQTIEEKITFAFRGRYKYCADCDDFSYTLKFDLFQRNFPQDCPCGACVAPSPSVSTICGLGVCASSGSLQCIDNAVQSTCVSHPPLSTNGQDFPGSSMDENCDGIDACSGHGALVLKNAEKTDDDDDDDSNKQSEKRDKKRSEKQGEKLVCVCEDGYSSKSDCSTCVKPKKHTVDVCRDNIKVTLCLPKERKSRKHDDDDKKSEKKGEKKRKCLDEPRLATDVIPGTGNLRCDCLEEVGACFPDPSTTCVEMSSTECATIGGTFTTNGAKCPLPTGGCRSVTGICLSGTYTEYACTTTNASNVYLGDGVPCVDNVDK